MMSDLHVKASRRGIATGHWKTGGLSNVLFRDQGKGMFMGLSCPAKSDIGLSYEKTKEELSGVLPVCFHPRRPIFCADSYGDDGMAMKNPLLRDQDAFCTALESLLDAYWGDPLEGVLKIEKDLFQMEANCPRDACDLAHRTHGIVIDPGGSDSSREKMMAIDDAIREITGRS